MKNFSSAKLTRRALTPLFCLTVFVFGLTFIAKAQTGIPNADRELKLWQTFSPEGAKFKVSLPQKPEALQLPLEFENLKFGAYRLTKTSAVYTVAFASRAMNKAEEDIVKQAWEDLPGVVEKVSASLSAGKEGYVVSQKNLSTPSLLGYEIIVQRGATLVKIRYYFSKDTFYGLEMATPVLHNAPEELVKIYQAESDKFFNSFQILDNKKSENPSKGKK